MPQVQLRELRSEDWPEVKAIYEQGIAGRNATFETEAPDWSEWDRSHLEGHRLVALEDGRVVGWTALSPVSDRCCGFRVVGLRERLARLGGVWRDVLFLERRSEVIA